MGQKFASGARMTLAASCLAADTSIQVQAALADRLPVLTTSNWSAPLDWCRATIQDNTGAFEIVKLGFRASGSAVVTNVLRGQEGTTALPWAAGATLQSSMTAQDIANVLQGIIPQQTITNGVAAASWALVGGVMGFFQASPDGTLGTQRMTFDQTNGKLTVTDFGISSDERLKTGWRKVPKHFVQRLAEVKHGIFKRKETGRREVGVSAQSLREVLPQAVGHDPKDGMLTVAYPQAALVAAIELAIAHGELQAEVADLRERVRRLERAR